MSYVRCSLDGLGSRDVALWRAEKQRCLTRFCETAYLESVVHGVGILLLAGGSTPILSVVILGLLLNIHPSPLSNPF